jgi:hypothetical protein
MAHLLRPPTGAAWLRLPDRRWGFLTAGLCATGELAGIARTGDHTPVRGALPPHPRPGLAPLTHSLKLPGVSPLAGDVRRLAKAGIGTPRRRPRRLRLVEPGHVRSSSAGGRW